MDSEILLQATDVGVRFGGIKALDGINFTLNKGELRCLIGSNGAGKTTFFRCLTGSQRPSQGQILFRGKNTAGSQRYAIARAGIGIKTQIPQLFEGLDALENVWLGLRGIASKTIREQTAWAALERVGVSHLGRKVVGNLAHGQRQLIELAMVIASDPELVLLDEPAAGMTGKEVERLAEIILEINQRHAVVVVEHDMHFIRMIGQRVTVFHQGRILVEDSVEGVLANPQVREVYLGKAHAH